MHGEKEGEEKAKKPSRRGQKKADLKPRSRETIPK